LIEKADVIADPLSATYRKLAKLVHPNSGGFGAGAENRRECKVPGRGVDGEGRYGIQIGISDINELSNGIDRDASRKSSR
jgi:hypothetical protein